MKSDEKRGLWRMVHAERAALVDDLAGLEADLLDGPGVGALAGAAA
ncbi:hypothetical protein [Streptomyces rubiginosohelvolus]